MQQYQRHTFYEQHDLDAAHTEGVNEGAASMVRAMREAAVQMYPFDIAARHRVEWCIDRALGLR